MIKILHAADLHLDSKFRGLEEGTASEMRETLRMIPEKIGQLCRDHGCQLLLLAGDVFDGEDTAQSRTALKNALEEVKIPVFISPGNHDFCGPAGPWDRENWPSNVHIFRHPEVESISLPELDCRVYGAGFLSMDCRPLLDGFEKQGPETYHIGVFHGDPTQLSSPCNPISKAQVAASALDYLALGHIHKAGSFREGNTLCGWPGCPMGRGFDEQGEKGVYLVEVADRAELQLLPLDTPRFFEWEVAPSGTPENDVACRLPAVGNKDFYRITLVGEREKPDIQELYRHFSMFPNLEFRDRTQPPVDIWGDTDGDSLEGLYFQMLRRCYEEEGERETALLAAEISRKILNGSEVVLP